MHDHQALHTLASHLQAHNVSATIQGDHIVITNGDSQIRVTPTATDCANLRSSNAEQTQQAVNSCLAQAGLPGVTSTTYRPVAMRRSRLDSNFEDIVLRSKILAKCPNPSEEVMRQFTPLARRVARRVFLRFKFPLKAFGYERDDLESVAMVHLVTALHRYRCGDPERDTIIVGRYLRQRLTEVVRKVQRKSLRCSSDTRMRSFSDIEILLDKGRGNV